MTRRELVALGAAMAIVPRFRFALRDDAFAGRPFPRMCEAVREAGFSGIEIAPATLAPDPTGLSSLQRRELRNAMVDTGLHLAALYNLLESPPGLHATTADATVRRRTWDYIRRLIDLCADLGDGPVLAFDGARQRAAAGGMTPAEATARLRDGLSEIAPAARIRGVTLALQPVSPQSGNVVNTIEAAADIVRRVNNPSVRAMFDTRHTAAEILPPGNLVRAYGPLIRHIRVSDPGEGTLHSLMQALKDTGYAGWISAALSGSAAEAERSARETAARLRRIEAGLR